MSMIFRGNFICLNEDMDQRGCTECPFRQKKAESRCAIFLKRIAIFLLPTQEIRQFELKKAHPDSILLRSIWKKVYSTAIQSILRKKDIRNKRRFLRFCTSSNIFANLRNC